MRSKPDIVEIPDKMQTGSIYDFAIGVGDKIDPQNVVNIAFSFKFRQIVQSSNHDRDLELKTSELMLTNPDLFLAAPISSILDPERAGERREEEMRSYSRRFLRANDKNPALAEIHDHCLAVAKSESLASDIRLAADELVTNAIYNAPHVRYAQNGPGAPRTTEYGEAQDLKEGEVFIGHNESRLILGCADAYGTLNPSHLITRLKACFDNGVAQSVNQGTGGAGIGTFIIFQSAAALYVGVVPNKRTVICCSFSLERRQKTRAALPKNLHISSDAGSSS